MVLEEKLVDQLAYEDWLLKVEPVAGVLEHDDVVIRDCREITVVEFAVIENFALERLFSVEHQTSPVVGAIDVREPVNVFLVVVDCG